MKETTRRRCLDLLLIAGAAFIGVVLIKKLFFIVFPVGMGYLFSEAVRSSFRKLKPVSLPVRRVLIILILMILFALLLLAGVLATEKLLAGARALGEGLESAIGSLTAWLEDATARTGKWLSGILHKNVETAVADMLSAMLTEGAKRLAQKLPEWVGKLAGGIPTLLISFVLFLFSGYYFSCEWDRARTLFYRLCPEDKREDILRRKAGFLRALKKLLRAYGLLFLITFGELAAGFWFLGISGAAGKALVISAVDALPVFGCGTVLLPWSAALFLQGKTAGAVGLLILYLVQAAARQVLEPRIVGRSIGLHPVVSLILMLAGLTLFGVWGMFLTPLTAACFLNGNAPGNTAPNKTKETPS